MSELYQKLKDDRIAAMKSRDKERKDTLTVFIGDLATEEKRGTTITDAMVIARLKKSIQNADDNYVLTSDEKFKSEASIYSGYLPKQLTDEELDEVVTSIVASQDNPNIGKVMGVLKSQYDGQFDGATAAKLIKSKI